MAQGPLVTVVTVTYNSSAYVRDAIESILASSYENFELIIGDDASSDDTWKITQEYSDPRIIKYRNEVNIGEYPNRNKSISLAKGEYLIFIDGDDMIYPHGLEFMVRMIDRCSACGMALMYPYLNWIFLPVMISSKDFYLSNFFRKGFNDIAFANTLFKTRILREFSGLPLNYKSGDVYMRLKIAAKYPTLIMHDQLTWWRETPGQASEKLKDDPKSVIENFELHSEIILWSENPMDSNEKRWALENELFKVKMRIMHCLRHFKIEYLIALMTLVWRSELTFKIITAQHKFLNPFDVYSSKQPLRNRLLD